MDQREPGNRSFAYVESPVIQFVGRSLKGQFTNRRDRQFAWSKKFKQTDKQSRQVRQGVASFFLSKSEKKKTFLLGAAFTTPAQQEIEKVRALDKEIDVLQSSNEECEKLNKELDSEISKLEQRLTVCKEETASDRHRTGVVETKLAVVQTRFIASLSHVQVPDIGVKLTFDSMDTYIEKLQQIIEENATDYKELIADIKEALADFKC